MEAETQAVRVRKVIAAQLEIDIDRVTITARFAEDLRADSLALVETILALEETFDIEISDEEAERMKTVGDVIAHVAEKSRS